MESNQDSNWPLVFRQRAWFRPHVVVDDLPPFPTDGIDTIQVTAPNTWGAKLPIGRGPVTYQLPATYQLHFEHGEEPYPSFMCPSTGPSGAALLGEAARRNVSVHKDSALFLVEFTLVRAAPSTWVEQYDAEMEAYSKTGGPRQGPMIDLLWNPLSLSRRCLDMIVGAYSLYQYPLVWELLTRSQEIIHVDLENGSFKAKSPIDSDNFVPFLLRADDKIVCGRLADAVGGNLDELFQLDMHLPLVLLQQNLWQKDLRLRFLTQFWIMEHLSHKHADGKSNPEVRSFVEKLEQVVKQQFPEHADFFRKKKGSLINPSLADIIVRYCDDLGISTDERLVQQAAVVVNLVSGNVGAEGERISPLKRLIRHAIMVRNRLSHGGEAVAKEVAGLELLIRELARRMIRKEVETAGVVLQESDKATAGEN